MWPPAPGRAAQALPSPPSSERNRPSCAAEFSALKAAMSARISRPGQKWWKSHGKILGRNAERWDILKKHGKTIKKKLGVETSLSGGDFQSYQHFEANRLLAQFSCQRDNLACVLDANTMRNWSANCSVSPKSGCDNWDNRLNSSWSSPLGPSAHIMSSMRLDFQEFFSRISGHWLKRRHAMLMLKLTVSHHHGSAIDRLIDQHCLFSHLEGVIVCNH